MKLSTVKRVWRAAWFGFWAGEAVQRRSFFPTSTPGPWMPGGPPIFFFFRLTQTLSCLNHFAYAPPSKWKLVWISLKMLILSVQFQMLSCPWAFLDYPRCFWISVVPSVFLRLSFATFFFSFGFPYTCFILWIGWNSRKDPKCLGFHCIWKDAFYSPSGMGNYVLPWSWARTLAYTRDLVFNPRSFCS